MVSSNTYTFLFIEKKSMTQLHIKNNKITKPTLKRTKSRSKKIYSLDVSEENKENEEPVILSNYFENYF